jgi:hypothetical protein
MNYHDEIKAISSIKEKDELLPIDSAATLLGVSQQTLRLWEKSGKLLPSERTTGGHRRYLKSEIDRIRKQQMTQSQILIPNITAIKAEQWINQLFGAFDPLEPLNLTITNDHTNNQVIIEISSKDGLNETRKKFNLTGESRTSD